MVVTTGTAATSLLALNRPWLMLVLMSEELVNETPDLRIGTEAALEAAVIDQGRKGLFVDTVLGVASQICALVKPRVPPLLRSACNVEELSEGSHLIHADEARPRAIEQVETTGD